MEVDYNRLFATDSDLATKGKYGLLQTVVNAAVITSALIKTFTRPLLITVLLQQVI